MSFKEKSSWIVLIGMAVILVGYGSLLASLGGLAAGGTALIVTAVIAFIVMAAAGHAIVAILAKDFDDTEDERDKRIELQGEQAGGVALGMIVLLALAMALIGGNMMMANLLFLGLVLSEVVKTAWQVILYRRLA